MRVLLQGADGLFFQDEGRWVKDPAEGHCFKNGIEVIDFAAKNSMTGVIVVYEFGGKTFDFTVPLKALEESTHRQRDSQSPTGNSQRSE